MEYHNRKRTEPKEYKAGEKVFVKLNKGLENKINPRYKEEIVKENKNGVIITNSGRIVTILD